LGIPRFLFPTGFHCITCLGRIPSINLKIIQKKKDFFYCQNFSGDRKMRASNNGDVIIKSEEGWNIADEMISAIMKNKADYEKQTTIEERRNHKEVMLKGGFRSG